MPFSLNTEHIKHRISYDEWIVNGMHKFTEEGNMKPAYRHTVLSWILEAWNKLRRSKKLFQGVRTESQKRLE